MSVKKANSISRSQSSVIAKRNWVSRLMRDHCGRSSGVKHRHGEPSAQHCRRCFRRIDARAVNRASSVTLSTSSSRSRNRLIRLRQEFQSLVMCGFEWTIRRNSRAEMICSSRTDCHSQDLDPSVLRQRLPPSLCSRHQKAGVQPRGMVRLDRSQLKQLQSPSMLQWAIQSR